ncbi:MAG: hypothetical protein R2939_21830 [Kofleriaceae bacterium]
MRAAEVLGAATPAAHGALLDALAGGLSPEVLLAALAGCGPAPRSR